MINVAVLFGGKSCEHDVSIITGLQVINNLDKKLYNIIPIYINKNGEFLFNKKFNNIKAFNAFNVKGKNVVFGNNGNVYIKHFGAFRKFTKIDVAIPCFHGVNGEDGSIVGVLKHSNIPYTCSNILASSLSIDKCAFKNYVKSLGVPVIKGFCLNLNDYYNCEDGCVNKILSKLKLPLIIKPSKLGSSIGIKVCSNTENLKDLLKDCFKYDNELLIEEFKSDIREINCAVLGNRNKLYVSELEEPLKSDEILSFGNKYLNSCGGKNSLNNLKRKMPPNIDDKLYSNIVKISVKIFKNLNIKGVCRFDFIICDNKVYLNELNSIPGSLAFYLFKPKNINFKELLNIIINCAVKENDDNNKLITYFNNSILNNFNNDGKLGKFGKL